MINNDIIVRMMMEERATQWLLKERATQWLLKERATQWWIHNHELWWISCRFDEQSYNHSIIVWMMMEE